MQVQVLLTSAPSSAPASLTTKSAENTTGVEEGDWPRGDTEVLAFFRKVRLPNLLPCRMVVFGSRCADRPAMQQQMFLLKLHAHICGTTCSTFRKLDCLWQVLEERFGVESVTLRSDQVSVFFSTCCSALNNESVCPLQVPNHYVLDWIRLKAGTCFGSKLMPKARPNSQLSRLKVPRAMTTAAVAVSRRKAVRTCRGVKLCIHCRHGSWK